jgi:hypothetical protein
MIYERNSYEALMFSKVNEKALEAQKLIELNKNNIN